jgi:hypothetical protein
VLGSRNSDASVNAGTIMVGAHPPGNVDGRVTPGS